MRNTPRLPEEDDGRQIADMSGIERSNLFMPRFGQNSASDAAQRGVPPEPGQQPELDRPWEQGMNDLNPKERRMYILGAMKASMLIGLVYVGGLGAVILLLIWLWS